MSSGSDRFVHVDPYTVVDPEQVDGLSFRRGIVTLHLRSGRAMHVTTKYDDRGVDWAIAETLAALYPAPSDTPPPPPFVLD